MDHHNTATLTGGCRLETNQSTRLLLSTMPLSTAYRYTCVCTTITRLVNYKRLTQHNTAAYPPTPTSPPSIPHPTHSFHVGCRDCLLFWMSHRWFDSERRTSLLHTTTRLMLMPRRSGVERLDLKPKLLHGPFGIPSDTDIKPAWNEASDQTSLSVKMKTIAGVT